MKIISVVGARPNFMKIAPFIKAINEQNSKNNTDIKHILVHTGQHYDDRMSKTFFEELNIPEADINLGVGSGTHAEQVGHTMIEFEKVLKAEKPDWVIVVGDVNATLACSITAKKEMIKCCHIEAGLRSGDLSMPEEINRIVTDRVSDLLLVPDNLSANNLKNEGITSKQIVFVGNIMIDTLEEYRYIASQRRIDIILKENSLNKSLSLFNLPADDAYAVVTLHRPSNVDNLEILKGIIEFLRNEVALSNTILWPIHPRTLKQLIKFNLFDMVSKHKNIILLEPLGYLDMLRLNMGAKIMLTDSGGIQEECTVLGTPCLTLRWNTERPVTLREFGGSTVLVGNNISQLRKEYHAALLKGRTPFIPKLWDGRTAERCLSAILKYS